ncbi:MAG: M10 family metallopeptidase C-terminal domain-containing protein, partial [Caulobacteraceae bacterium]
GGGDDTVSGGGGSDDLDGGAGDDDLDGGKGDDTLVSGGGDDTLTGGVGDDDFRFTSATGQVVNVTDFEVGSDGDIFDLSAIDANPLADGDQGFTFVESFSGAAGEATLSYDAGTGVTTASFYTDGDATADLTLLIQGEVTSDPANWVL